MASSCRIDFTGQMGGSEPICISRTKPVAMSAHMPSAAWKVFCNQINEVLKPLESIKRRTQIVKGLGSAIFFGFSMIAFFYLLSAMGHIQSIPVTAFFVAFTFFGIVFLVIAMIYNHVRTQAQVKKVLRELERVCRDTSNKFSSLSFHVHMDNLVVRRKNSYNIVQGTNSIEVSIANPEVGASAAGVPAFGLEASSEAYPALISYFPAAYPIPVPIVGASVVQQKTAVERLGELEGLKGIISTEEYERKRKAILDGI